jgi:hypothetical protein
MHKFHTLQCKNNKLLLSNHHLLWCNIYTLWGSSSSVLAHGYVALTNDMLKAYKVAQVWIFLSGWLQEAYFLKTKSNNNNLCILRTKWDAIHFFLECPLYQHDRTSLFNYFNNIVPISIEYILFGCNEISEEFNTLLFKSVQKLVDFVCLFLIMLFIE